MKAARTVVLDNEAVQALVDVTHRKQGRVLAAVEVTAARNLRRAGSVRLVVPTAVRFEAGWDRRARRSAAIDSLRVDDSPLDSHAADTAAAVVSALGASAADAHLGCRASGPESLRNWLRHAEIDSGGRPGTSSADTQRVAELEGSRYRSRSVVKGLSPRDYP